MAFIVSGCVCALSPTGTEGKFNLKLDSPRPRAYRILVASPIMMIFYFDDMGRTTISVPPLHHGCRSYLGGLKISDETPKNRKVIYLFEGEEIARRISVNDIERMKTDSSGYRILEP